MPALDSILLASASRNRAVPIVPVQRAKWAETAADLPQAARQWAAAHGFEGQAGRHLVVPDGGGGITMVLAGTDEKKGNPFSLGALARSLPAGTYALGDSVADPRLVALGWCLEAYSYGRYRKVQASEAALVCPKSVDRAEILRLAEASFMVRDLINTPSSDFGPEELEAAAKSVAKRFRAPVKVTSGKSLEREFPLVHTVGKASTRPPRLIDFSWGNPRSPKVTLVGKGVCFDSGGLDIKPASGMLLMKKDMGGAATVLGLAQLIMAAKLPVRLRVLIPAVENAIAGNAFRPGDVIRSRKGLTVEIGNTDAEGRLILADALALADAEKPDLLIDMATLTGAARVALGPDLAPYYTDDDAAARALEAAAQEENDQVWRMPLWRPYGRLFESSIADLNNSGESGFAGSITAALFLRSFVEQAKTYLHFDIYGWTPQARPGHPKGGAAQALRALFTMISARYKK